jgi:hypothetical protein
MATIVTFTSSGLFVYTGSANPVSISVWGAGGNGGLNGNGGSGAAFASSSIVLGNGTYSCSVAGLGGIVFNPTTTSSSLGYNPIVGDGDLFGNSSSFYSASSSTVKLVSAMGGSSLGTIYHQTGSAGFVSGSTYMLGGIGGQPVVYNADGCGGGGAGGWPSGSGTASLGSPGSSDSSIGDSRSLASAGGPSGGTGVGGNGAYYDAGSNVNRIVSAQNGATPGGGGGGPYIWGANTPGLGGAGQITISF